MSTTVRRFLVGCFGVLLAIAVWQLASMIGPLAESPMPSAGEAITTMLQLLTTVDLWLSTLDTLVIAVVGLLAAIVVGVALGIAIGSSPLVMHATRVIVEFFKPIPPIVVLPIVVLVLGPTPFMGIFLVIIGCTIAIAIQTSAGVFDTDPVRKATGETFGLSRAEVLRRIVLPSALPYIGTAVRVAAPTSLIVAVVAGLLGGGPGLGQSLLQAQLAGNQPELFAYVLILGLLGLVFQGVSSLVERRVLHWHPQFRKENP
ncbi:ABC transporter permease subunit [Brevibacterium permense]|uniref:ABC transporter permease n=1 Tax=Brevibacterium permense TaxID=234834 RepID=UPI0021CFFFF6|nr:ABC transporter permease subunit [Brevibacterium permense]MCU4299045.1 ABC transporter permease subunit [Brevibacterium permense]